MNTEKRECFHIYIASCTPDGGIYHYLFEKEQFHFIEKIDCDRPMYMAIEDNRLYALLRQPYCDNSHSGLISWDISDNGKLCNPSLISDTLGVCACHLAVEQQTVYITNYLSSSISKLPDKLLKVHEGGSMHPQRQTAPHPHCIIASPDNNYLVSADLGIDEVIVYDKDLNPISSTKVPKGHGARHLCFSEDGRFLFCVNELASTVSVFAYCEGHLTLQNTYPALPENFEGESTSAAIRVIKNHLYISNRGHDSITFYTIGNDGTLELKGFTFTGGSSPRDFNLFSDWLFCANELTDNVTCFKKQGIQLINSELELQIPKPLAIVFY